MPLADPPIDRPHEVELPVHASSVTTARREMARIADAVGAPREDVELAVAEAVGNAVVHGYPGSDGGRIVVRAEVSSAKLTITVADDGSGLRPDPASPGLGLGLPLIARVSSRYRIEAGPEGGTVVAMEFRRGGASGG